MSEVKVSDLKLKRQRGKNFTEWEKDMLIDLILPFKSIIENMKTDAVWNQKKTEAWSEITCLYNMQQKSGIRIDVQLKHLYDGLKRDARKEKSHDKVQMYITGGGTHIPSISKSTEKIFGLLGEQLDPLNNVVDCDSDYNTGYQSVDVEDIVDDGTSNNLCNRDSAYVLPNYDVICDTFEPESKSLNESVPSSSCTPKSNLSENLISAKSKNINVNESKQISSKKVYEGLSILNNKRLAKTENTTKFEDELHTIRLKKAKVDLEVSELEKTLMTQKIKFEVERQESESRQNKFKEEILLLELKQKKKMFGLE